MNRRVPIDPSKAFPVSGDPRRAGRLPMHSFLGVRVTVKGRSVGKHALSTLSDPTEAALAAMFVSIIVRIPAARKEKISPRD